VLNYKLEEGLSIAGHSPEELQATLAAINEVQDWALAAKPAEKPKLAYKPLPIVRVRKVKEDDKEKPKGVPLTPDETIMLEKIKRIPFGTWFDVVINQQGVKARRKLSWFSTVSNRALFVNARGAKIEECSLESLARDMLRGNVSVVDQRRENFVDRAMGKITGFLRNLTRESAPAGATP
jgi:hypothetical protein